jgi:hypothetical protein
MKQIIIKIVNTCGENKVFPVCDKAHSFAAMNGYSYLTPLTLRCIEELGYTVVTLEN